MNLMAGMAIYMIVWWLVLFAVLPFGIVSDHENGDVKPGFDPGAPARPMLIRKALITTLIASVLWACIYYVVTYKPISLDSFPFQPKYHDY
jgi:predicted secreted protein